MSLHIGDIAPVRTTEIGRTAQLAGAFARRRLKPLGLSTDEVASHPSWTDDVNATQHSTLGIPLIADPEGRVARLCGMIHAHERATGAQRSAFIIDPDKTIRLTLAYPTNVGRDVDEILRVIDALRTAGAHRVAAPADGTPGDAAILPTSIRDDAAKTLFPQGRTEARPDLRATTLSPRDKPARDAPGVTG